MNSLILVVAVLQTVVLLCGAAPSSDLHEESHVIKKRSLFDEMMVRALRAGCDDIEASCAKEKYYKNIPEKGYDTDAGCRAMKAMYECADAGCSDPDRKAKYKEYITGYNHWCP